MMWQDAEAQEIILSLLKTDAETELIKNVESYLEEFYVKFDFEEFLYLNPVKKPVIVQEEMDV